MLTINYPNWDSTIEDWKEHLEGLVISHKLIENRALSQPILTHGRKVLAGEDKIKAYLQGLENQRDTWFACVCD